MTDISDVVIYTDGACSGNPGPGGWAAILMAGGAKKELSGGEKRRVAAVRAMEHKADFYLLDEPFTGLDVKACEDMVKYIDRKRGMAAVIITAHDEEDLPETWQQELKMFRL